ncbi:hypothetical protein LV78_005291 [Actinosynnema pretiosum]|nr:hypothetical protein [Actinosynnema pretiosum]
MPARRPARDGTPTRAFTAVDLPDAPPTERLRALSGPPDADRPAALEASCLAAAERVRLVARPRHAGATGRAARLRDRQRHRHRQGRGPRARGAGTHRPDPAGAAAGHPGLRSGRTRARAAVPGVPSAGPHPRPGRDGRRLGRPMPLLSVEHDLGRRLLRQGCPTKLCTPWRDAHCPRPARTLPPSRADQRHRRPVARIAAETESLPVYTATPILASRLLQVACQPRLSRRLTFLVWQTTSARPRRRPRKFRRALKFGSLLQRSRKNFAGAWIGSSST